jgi:hypothetical protein
MPYARRTYKKRTYSTRRYGRRSYARKAVKPLPKRKTKATYIRRNAYAVNRISRKVNFLMSARWGQVQKNFHTSDALVPTSGAPICFDATNFTCKRLSAGGTIVDQGCKIWQVSATGVGITQAGTWGITNDVESSPFWWGATADIPDGGVYKPLRASYTLQIRGRPSLDDTYIDIFLLAHRPKAVTLGPGVNGRIMPTALQFMKRISQPDNTINWSFFKKYYHKRIYINSQTYINSATPPQGVTSQGMTSTTGNTRTVKFTIHPKKVRTQLTTWPEVPGVTTDPTTAPAPQEGDLANGIWYGTNAPITEPLWCVISCNDQSALFGDSVNVKMSREVVWRDSIGHSAVSN